MSRLWLISARNTEYINRILVYNRRTASNEGNTANRVRGIKSGFRGTAVMIVITVKGVAAIGKLIGAGGERDSPSPGFYSRRSS